MTNILRDVAYGFRSLRRTPAFTILSLVTIALGIAASTAIFSMVNGALLKPLPYAADDRVIRLQQPTAAGPGGAFSVVEVKDYRGLTQVFEGVAEYPSMPFQFYGKGEPQRVQTGVVSDNFFKLLGVRPVLGRDFGPGEEEIDRPRAGWWA
ncbi:MAG TPA: ABC transporter permease [Gemmatimonadaceae bacterium]